MPSKRQRKREAVRAALVRRRLERRAGHPAMWERRDRDYWRWTMTMERHCKCCYWCRASACDAVLQGGFCERICRCDDDNDDRYFDSDEGDWLAP